MILSVHYLRAVAALIVLLFHLTAKIPVTPAQKLSAEVGGAGVDIFFVISGVAMAVSTHGRHLSPLGFYARRLVRIVPLYWLITSLVVLVVAVAPSVAGTSRLDPWHAAASYLFLAWPHPGNPTDLAPLLVLGWTLNYEMVFYVLVGATLLLPRQRLRLAVLSGLILGLVALGELVALGPRGTFYTSPLILEFLAGFAVARLWLGRRRLPPALGLAGIALALALFATVGPVLDPQRWDRLLRWGVPAVLLVASAIAYERVRPVPESRTWRLLGDASYAIYLVQFLGVPAFALAWRALRLPVDAGPLGLGFLLTGAVAVSLAAILVHRLVERPILEAMQGRGAGGAGRPIPHTRALSA